MRDIAERDAKTKVLLGRFASYCRAMFLQIAACNRLHNLRARCSRSLLTLQDNAEGNNFALPHEFFALLLGTNRTSLSLLLEEFQREKILGKRDRSIMILNRSALEQETCECYAVLRAECDRIFHD
jgi:hypothetical protein